MVSSESQKPLQRGSVAARKFWQFVGFCGNFHQNSRCFVAKFPSSVHCFNGEKILIYSVLLTNFHKNCCYLVENFHKKLHFWLVSTKKCLYGKFPQKKVSFMENFHQTSLGWKISTTTGFVGKFPQQQALLENFRKNLLC